MKTWKQSVFISIFAIFSLIFTVIACKDDNGITNNENNNNGLEQNYPILKVVNKHSNASISYVRLVGYDFNNLNISPNESQSFSLTQGMPGGFNNINVSIGMYGGSIKVNFANGKTTTLTLIGGWAEGSPPTQLVYDPPR